MAANVWMVADPLSVITGPGVAVQNIAKKEITNLLLNPFPSFDDGDPLTPSKASKTLPWHPRTRETSSRAISKYHRSVRV